MIILVDLEILTADALYRLIRVTIDTPVYILLVCAVFWPKPLESSRWKLYGKFLADRSMCSFGSFYGEFLETFFIKWKHVHVEFIWR